MRPADPDEPTGSVPVRERVAAPVAVKVAAVLLLVVVANGWAAGYVSAERSIYAWDWAAYWLMFQNLGGLLRTNAGLALAAIGSSIALDDSNVLPVVPLMPFYLVFGPGRLSYILAIVNVGVLPGAALMALVADRAIGGRSWSRLLLCTAGILCLHVLWAPVLRGFPDVVGVAVACVVLLAYVGTPPRRQRVGRLAAIGFLLCLLILTRRYYLFWAIGFFPAALLAYACGTPRADLRRGDLLAVARNLAVIAAACGALLLILAAPLVLRLVTSDYSAAYAAYRSDLAGTSTAGQVVGQFGVAVLAVCVGGLVWLAARRETRSLGVMLIAQALIAFCLFTVVQTLFGVQHFYLLVPAAGIGLAAAIAGVWTSGLRGGWRAVGVAAVMTPVVLGSATVFSASGRAAGPLSPRVRYAPLTRPDLPEVRRLLAALAALKPDHVYVAASSQAINWSILQMGCRETQPALCSHIAVTQDIDTRDGFPRGVLDADYVVLATPTQYHVRPEDQRVVGLVARDIREGRGIGDSFTRMPGEFSLADGVTVTIHHRIAPLGDEAVRALSEELVRDYPRMRRLFERPDA